ncbi:MAG: Isomerizing Glutamine-fructose-6-phosphate aminotransferase [Candidatus Moranbacteria bacterium GW2011_GWF2_36_839]|nr:MAG: Isomerizing Glutamine-fructose-6-phosphate aminotransferase [Candidatus Moranbacteria bacterium GW2011_GWF1_36_78]KKQ16775.1 MAG: Isomerizing Glutamine-fructose-6-phosphate aminotransferase [Candidatus Moranbacteria bacterium GW2011_GWF2_36_839]HAT73581.1 glutamine--fructose-6-phosphate transaminase (isomerizing) [Candidatus Moranbacteria bacterium]HBY10608.1 glutamine--fructose-6-phosphate transaminase (isomerizing) [Candidatus Moranbacteria bacterium]
MCGIIAYIGKQKAVSILLEGLKQLEYRGYDSAGISVIQNEEITTIKAVGKVMELQNKIGERDFSGNLGIAHTRWATHGKPSDTNSHPHGDCEGNIFLVHNGIIENYQELKNILIKKKHKFVSETDSEVLAHLIEEFNKKNDFKKSVLEALKLIRGTYGLAIINKNEPDKIIIARNGSPLILGIGKDEFIVASDASAIVRHTDKVIYLDDGEMAQISADGFEISNIKNKTVSKEISKLNWTLEESKKGGFDHFMLKEIFEQPEVISNGLRGRVEHFLSEDNFPILGGLRPIEKRLRRIKKIIIVACGTSYYSGLVGEYMLEEYAGIPTEVEYASEFRYRKPILDSSTAVVAISQSGETADTLAAIREAKNKGALTLGIVNVVGSTIARETDAGTHTLSGPEIGVASTKAFTTQLVVLVLWTLMLGRQRDMANIMSKRIAQELKNMPKLIDGILKKSKEIKKIAKKYSSAKDFLYLGRKYNFPIALEGALKIKEISYVHAEGYATGEMKHGPIALIDENFPSIFICPKDSVYEKNISGMQEIKARGGKIIAIATMGDKEIARIADDVIYIPKTLEMLTPFVSVIPLQLFAYYFGVAKGYDVDKPRNLAKSVTVE